MLEQLLAALRGKRLPLQDEKALQRELEAHLLAAAPALEREVRLSEADIIDFLAGGVGIEVKIKGTPKAIYRQCARYCDSPRVAVLLLVTNKQLTLPPTLNGKPTHVFNLGKAWL